MDLERLNLLHHIVGVLKWIDCAYIYYYLPFTIIMVENLTFFVL